MTAFRLLDHPADLGIEASGSTPGEAYAMAARGLMTVILDPDEVRPAEERRISLEAGDPEHLLVRWLSEVLYLYDGERFAPCEFSVTTPTPMTLVATVRGEPFDPNRHHTRLDVKAITYHQILVAIEPRQTLMRVYLDI